MASCARCYFLTMSRESEEHVIWRHFLFEDWEDPRQSFFFPNRISPQELFFVVQNIPRRLLEQIRWSYGGRFMYTIPFDFDLGVYPAQGHGCTTNRIAIICECVYCRGCDTHVPTDIVSIYPWDEYCAEYGRY